MEEPYPAITSGDGERGYATGYALRKGGSFNRKYYANGGGHLPRRAADGVFQCG